MAELLAGIDLGTTKTTAIALNRATGSLAAVATSETQGQSTSERDRDRGRSEWDTRQLVESGLECLRRLAEKLGPFAGQIVSLGITGQQHGCVVIDGRNEPVSPFINWQDQRGIDRCPSESTGTTAEAPATWVDVARKRLGHDAVRRTGCRLNTGFMATTLFWLNEHGMLPAASRACFLMDLFAAALTGSAPRTDPTLAGSAGVLDVARRRWDEDAIKALGLRLDQFPDVGEASECSGQLTPQMAERTGLPAGLPIGIPIGDHQASFVGTVRDRHSSVLLNVGTGAQVAVYTDGSRFEPPIELRPFPIRGNLQSNVGLTGGWSFQVIARFIADIGRDVFGVDSRTPAYDTLTALAAAADSGAQGLVCLPTFSGTRANPLQRGALTGISPRNLTPGNLVRATIEGMAANYRGAWDQITALGGPVQTQLVGAGNGLRENHVLRDAVTAAFGMAPQLTPWCEEAAVGAALTGAVAAGVFPDLDAACSSLNSPDDAA